jgi:DNA-binding CsgD family transcriptional regulator
LTDLLTPATENQSGVLLVEGGPGMGKTHFIREVTRVAERNGFSVATNLGTGRELSPTAALLSSLSETLYRVRISDDPVLGRVEARVSLSEWLRGRIQEHAAHNQLLIALDDLHSSSAATVRILSELPEQLRHHRLVWIFTRRSGAGGPEVDRLFDASGTSATHVELTALSADAVSELTEEILGARPHEDVLTLVAAAGGIPFFIVELLQGLRDEGKVQYVNGVARLVSNTLPQRVQTTVAHHLVGLSEKCRQMLQVAAVLGTNVALDHLAKMLRETTAMLQPTVQEALSAGVLSCAGDVVVFEAEIVRRCLIESLPATLREALQREARSTTRYPFGYADSIPHRGGMPVPAAAHPLPARLQCALSGTLMMCGQTSQVFAAATQVLAEPNLTCRLYRSALAARVFSLSLLDPPRACQEAAAILAEAPISAEDVATVMAATVLSSSRWNEGELAEGLGLARQAVHHIGAATPPQWRPYVRLSLADKLADLHEWAEAQAIIQQTTDEIEQFALTTHAFAPPIVSARVLLRQGRLAEAHEQARAGVSLAGQVNGRFLVPSAYSVMATVALRMGNVTMAAAYVDASRAELAAGDGLLRSARDDWLDLLIINEQAGVARTAELLNTEYAGLVTERALFVAEPGAAAWFVRLAHSVGDMRFAETAVATAESLAADNPEFPTVGIGAAHARGLLDGNTAALEYIAIATEHSDPWARACAAKDFAYQSSAGVRTRSVGEGTAGEGLLDGHDNFSDDNFSDTELTIARLVSEGLTNRQIATRVSLSPHTVNYYLRQIFRKLGIQSRVELAAAFVRATSEGLLTAS